MEHDRIVAERITAANGRAATLLGFADAESERCGYRLFVHDRHHVEEARRRLRVKLGEDRFVELHTLGAATPFEELPTYKP